MPADECALALPAAEGAYERRSDADAKASCAARTKRCCAIVRVTFSGSSRSLAPSSDAAAAFHPNSSSAFKASGWLPIVALIFALDSLTRRYLGSLGATAVL